MPQNETIMLETPLFSIESNKTTSDAGVVSLSVESITFKHAQLYSLFKKFMDESISSGRSSSYLATFNDSTKNVKFGMGSGIQNLIGKFFLETNLDWPQPYYDTDPYLIAKYKQPITGGSGDEDYGKGVPCVYLGRRGIAQIPDSIMTLMNRFDPNDYIKEVAPLIAQAYRTSPASGFQFFKQEPILNEMAFRLDPEQGQAAIARLKSEIDRSYEYQYELLKKRPFSFKRDEIVSNPQQRTHVQIDATASFIDWLSQFDIDKSYTFDNGFEVFRNSENVVSFNKGLGTAGIKISNEGIDWFVSNNKKADETITKGTSNLTDALAKLYSLSFNKAKPLVVSAPAIVENPEPENNEKGLIM